MIDDMKPGSVIVDLAAEAGGNIETIVPGKLSVYNNVTHIGYTDLPSRLPPEASTLYPNNLSKLLLSVQGTKDHYFLDIADHVVVVLLFLIRVSPRGLQIHLNPLQLLHLRREELLLS